MHTVEKIRNQRNCLKRKRLAQYGNGDEYSFAPAFPVEGRHAIARVYL
jgi:hypothetical protein